MSLDRQVVLALLLVVVLAVGVGALAAFSGPRHPAPVLVVKKHKPGSCWHGHTVYRNGKAGRWGCGKGGPWRSTGGSAGVRG